MKLAQANARDSLLQPGDTYKAAGRNYRVVRVVGSTVTVEAIPTFIESVVSFFSSLVHPYRWALRRREVKASFRDTTPATGSVARVQPRRLSRAQRKERNARARAARG